MMEAVSGSVTAAGNYLKVAAGMDKEESDRETKTQKVRWLCNEGKICLQRGGHKFQVEE